MGTFPNKDTQFKPGNPGGPGIPKGSKHVSTWIQEILNDEEFETMLADRQEGWKTYKGAPLAAIVKVLAIKAMGGDVKAFEALAKHGWKQQLDITSNDEKLGVGLSAEQAEQLIRARADRSDS